MPSGDPHRVSGPVFVGGTGRCGTHVIASLAANSGRYAQVPSELRLHVSPDGLPAFVAGLHTRRRLLRGLRTHWWQHSPAWDPSQSRGAHCLASRRRYFTAVAQLAKEPPGANRLYLSRRFVSALLDPLAPAPGAWVEKSPDNCGAAGFLIQLFPEMRLIHAIRDGRDVACSFMRVPWAPNDFGSALALWEQGVRDAHRGSLEVPPERVHRPVLEDLVAHDRDRAYRELLAFLEIPEEPALRTFFDRELTSARARIGRWRTDIQPDHHEFVDSLYRASLERLAAAGVAPLPQLWYREAPRNAVRADAASSPSPLDPWAAATA